MEERAGLGGELGLVASPVVLGQAAFEIGVNQLVGAVRVGTTAGSAARSGRGGRRARRGPCGSDE